MALFDNYIFILPANGWYIYMESSNPNTNGDNTKLVSPTISGNNIPRCLSFWYHMYGPDVGALNLYILVSTPSNII